MTALNTTSDENVGGWDSFGGWGKNAFLQVPLLSPGAWASETYLLWQSYRRAMKRSESDLSWYTCAYITIYLSINQSIYLSIDLSIDLSLYLSLIMRLYVATFPIRYWLSLLMWQLYMTTCFSIAIVADTHHSRNKAHKGSSTSFRGSVYREHVRRPRATMSWATAELELSASHRATTRPGHGSDTSFFRRTFSDRSLLLIGLWIAFHTFDPTMRSFQEISYDRVVIQYFLRHHWHIHCNTVIATMKPVL